MAGESPEISESDISETEREQGLGTGPSDTTSTEPDQADGEGQTPPEGVTAAPEPEAAPGAPEAVADPAGPENGGDGVPGGVEDGAEGGAEAKGEADEAGGEVQTAGSSVRHPHPRSELQADHPDEATEMLRMPVSASTPAPPAPEPADKPTPEPADDRAEPVGDESEGGREQGDGDGDTAVTGDRPGPVDQPTTTLPRPVDADQPTTTLRRPVDAPKHPSGRVDDGEEGVAQRDRLAGADGPPGEDRLAAVAAPAAPAGSSGEGPVKISASSRFVALKTDDKPVAPPPQPGHPPPLGQAPAPVGPPPMPDSERLPLELLAELTNKPAPAPTPLRELLRRVKIWSPLAVLLMIVFVVAQLLRPLPAPELAITTAESYAFGGSAPAVPWPDQGQAALDVDGLGTFGTSGEQRPVPIASVAKTMTAYVILRDHPVAPDEEGARIPVDQAAEDEAGLNEVGESTVDVRAGETISQREAIQAIMIASGNNVARLLARWDAGSEEEFVGKMNEAAEELGMRNTLYTDPSGLRAETVSTAADQVILARAAMEDPVFRQVVRMPSYEDSRGQRHGNWNHLVPLGGVVGIKTGTTTAAGGNLLFAAEQEVGDTTQLIVGAVLAQPPHPSDNSILTGALSAGDQLMTFAQGELVPARVLTEGDVVGHVDDGLGGRTAVVVTEDVDAVGWPGLTVRLALTEGGDDLPATAKSGTEVGSLTIGDGPGQVEVPVALRAELTEPGWRAKLTRIL